MTITFVRTRSTYLIAHHSDRCALSSPATTFCSSGSMCSSWTSWPVMSPRWPSSAGSSAAAAPPCAPRSGSGSRYAPRAMRSPMTARTMKTPRHPNRAAAPPARRNPTPAPISSPLRIHDRIRPRSLGRYRSPVSDAIVGPPVAVTTPRNSRATKSIRNVTERPVATMAMLQIMMLPASSRTRWTRSVRTPTGTVATPPTTLNADARMPMSVFEMWNADLMLGASAPSDARSALSSARTSASTSTVSARSRPPSTRVAYRTPRRTRPGMCCSTKPGARSGAARSSTCAPGRPSSRCGSLCGFV